MKNLGKIGLAAGLAAALVLLFRRRKDGTRVLDDISDQFNHWAQALKRSKQSTSSIADTSNSKGRSAVSRPLSSSRQPGDINE
ncbi:MAG: hypothetical protein RLZ47_997 [Bacteroidota bacterium]|jgi:hypothetical protein